MPKKPGLSEHLQERSPMSKRKPRVKQISCQEAIGRVFDFIDAQLKGRSREELEQHLQACRHCFDRVEFERL
jgi:hypothetical protein